MFKKYLFCFLVSMVPFIELRGGVPFAVGMGLNYFTALGICVIGNMLPVPIIYLFARKVLIWGCSKKYIGKIFTFCYEKGEHGGHRLMKRAGRGGLFVALMLFVGIPIPGTGAWTGALVAAMLDMQLKRAFPAIALGVAVAGLIVTIATYGVSVLI